jgi:hypothetical protein
MWITLAVVAASWQLIAASNLTHDLDQPEATAASQPASIVVGLRSERPSYESGQDVRIKISVQNVAPLRLDLPLGAPWNQAILTITDSTGAVVKPDIQPSHPVRTGSFDTTSLEPRESTADVSPVAAYPFLVDSAGFVSLRGWGYELRSPGTYKIQASWFLGRDEAGKEAFARSNTVEVRVTN